MAKKSKRGNSEGSIYRRRDGLWVAEVTLRPDATGKRRRRQRYARTRRAAADKLLKLQEEGGMARAEAPARLKVRDYLKSYLDQTRNTVGDGAYRNYKRYLDKHIKPYAIAGTSLREVTDAEVEAWLADLVAAKAGARTRQAAFHFLGRALRAARKKGKIRENPCELVETPRVPKSEMRYLTPEQTRAFLDKAAADTRLHALAALLATTGLRVSEALGLRWRCVDLRSRVIRVEQRLDKNSLELGDVKTKSARRRVALPAEAVEALRAHRARLGATPHPSRPVFADQEGGFLRYSNVLRRWWFPCCDRAEIPRVGFHALRHGHATALLASGANPHAVARRLGHSRASTTLDLYTHALPGDDEQLAVATEAVLG